MCSAAFCAGWSRKRGDNRQVSSGDHEKNIELAKRKSQPLCQDTGSILFYVDCPAGLNQVEFEAEARDAVLEATKRAISAKTRWTRSPVKTTARTLAPVRLTCIFISMPPMRFRCA